MANFGQLGPLVMQGQQSLINQMMQAAMLKRNLFEVKLEELRNRTRQRQAEKAGSKAADKAGKQQTAATAATVASMIASIFFPPAAAIGGIAGAAGAAAPSSTPGGSYSDPGGGFASGLGKDSGLTAKTPTPTTSTAPTMGGGIGTAGTAANALAAILPGLMSSGQGRLGPAPAARTTSFMQALGGNSGSGDILQDMMGIIAAANQPKSFPTSMRAQAAPDSMLSMSKQDHKDALAYADIGGGAFGGYLGGQEIFGDDAFKKLLGIF